MLMSTDFVSPCLSEVESTGSFSEKVSFEFSTTGLLVE